MTIYCGFSCDIVLFWRFVWKWSVSVGGGTRAWCEHACMLRAHKGDGLEQLRILSAKFAEQRRVSGHQQGL
jgi:hypothetical protein